MGLWWLTIGLVCSLAASASAQSAPSSSSPPPAAAAAPPPAPAAPPPTAAAPPPAAVPPPEVATQPTFAGFRLPSQLQIHGFASEGGFVSTANEFIGESSRGSLKFFEAGINFTAQLTDQLRIGLQVVSRSVGTVSEELPRFDWALADYRWRAWLGVRAGLIKMPLGLYNEFVDIDAARTAILMPQSLYPIRNRDALISHTGFALYGDVPLGALGALSYQAWFGTLSIPRSALELDGARLDSVDTKYVAGGQLFWQPPVEGLRLGATYSRASIDFDLTLDADLISQLVTAQVVPADYDGSLVISQRPATWWVASAEYNRGDWLLAAEYLLAFKHQESTLPEQIIPIIHDRSEGIYALASYRFSPHFELGTYYAISHANVKDRRGHSARFTEPFHAYRRDLAATLRIDVNEYWLWKLEAHFIDGTAELAAAPNPDPTRYWGLFLFRTTVTF